MFEDECEGIGYVIANLVDAFIEGRVDALIHQANCFKTMGSGIAREISNRLPELRDADYNDPRLPEERLGRYTFHRYGRQLAFNAYGQMYTGANTNYEALRQSLAAISDAIKRSGVCVSTIGVPLMGCGIGGGDWNVVQGIIKDELSGFDVVVHYLSSNDLRRAMKCV